MFDARLKVLSAGIFSLLLTLGVARFAYTPLLPLMQQQAGLGVAQAGWLAAINYAGYLSGALLQAAGLGCETAVGVGDPAHVLVDIIESSGCDMVVIGARGQGAISSALLGSVSQELAHASPVPVTIVKHPEVLEVQDDLEGAADAAV